MGTMKRCLACCAAAWLSRVLLLAADVAGQEVPGTSEERQAALEEEREPTVETPGNAMGARCRASAACAEEGLCTADGNGCVAVSALDCSRSAACRSHGGCAAKKGRCVAATKEHCTRSLACGRNGHCKLSELGYCYAPRSAVQTAPSSTPEPSSRSTLWAGIALTVIGGGITALGVATWQGAESSEDSPTKRDGFGSSGDAEKPLGIVLSVIGGAGAIAGIGLMVAGAVESAREPDETESDVRAELLLGPTGGGLSVTF